MGIVHIMKRGGDDYHDFKKNLKIAYKAIEALCDLTEDMEEEYGYSERGGMSRRYHEEEPERMEMRRYR